MAKLPYDPAKINRELARHYIPASESDIQEMLKAVGSKSFTEMYSHIEEGVKFKGELPLPEEVGYQELADKMETLSKRNHNLTPFLGDGLQVYKTQSIVPFVCGIRNLTTSYTPYQPERSQGTLATHWIYQCVMSQLTGFEAINSSLYDRSTALYEAICCALRLVDEADSVLVAANIFPSDIEVLRTHAADTKVNIVLVQPDAKTGRISAEGIRTAAASLGKRLAAIAFPQVNNLGLLEDVDALTDVAAELGVKSIAIVDPMLLATGGLKQPAHYGKKGADIICGEAQHLAIGANFGGPGLGLFAVRYTDSTRNDVRATPGRFVGKAKDSAGRECLVMVMSTREQHIRRDKATSNICSNQAFIATVAGAAVLERGDQGLAASAKAGRDNAVSVASRLAAIPGLKICHADQAFWNEFSLMLPSPAAEVIQKGRAAGLHVGIDITGRTPCNCNLLKISFSDLQSTADCDRLVAFFEGLFGKASGTTKVTEVPSALRRTGAAEIPGFSAAELREFYTSLGEQNVSPDTGCFPLGSCTMKYNPHINDWAAGLEGFTAAHPQAPTEDVQACLEVIYQHQEWFKAITGLAGVVTQPVAGAQGELVGIKMFQAYHRARGDHGRDVLLIPNSAHGTNFATAATAGFETKVIDGKKYGIVVLKSAPSGEIDLVDLEARIAELGSRICGVMCTNPNTSGVFETNFRVMAERIHAIGGLVYMDGANMNAIAGWLDLDKLGVDAVHNNLHKTWTVPHGGGGPGDGMVAVSHRIVDFIPGMQIRKVGNTLVPYKAPKSIGSFHRHWGNFAHKVRVLTYLERLGKDGVRRMAAMSVLSARYLFQRLRKTYPSLPVAAADIPRMHEFILTLTDDDFKKIEAVGVPRASAIGRVGKLFLDFGYHAPTVAFPEAFGLMIEPTESYTKSELDRFAESVEGIIELIRQDARVLVAAPRFTPIDRVDDVTANRNLVLSEKLLKLPVVIPNRVSPTVLNQLPVADIRKKILATVG